MAEQETPKVAKKEGADIYEVGFHIVPTVAEGDIAGFFEGYKAKVTSHGASIIAEEAPKRTPLAYTMGRSESGKREKFNEAYFGWIKFECPTSEIEGLALEFKKDTNILRHLLITTSRESSGGARRLFTSDRLEGETIKKKQIVERKGGVMTEAEIDKTIDELVAEPAEKK